MSDPAIPPPPAPGQSHAYEWTGSEWVPVAGSVANGYRWDGELWVPVDGAVVDGQRWDGSQWVPDGVGQPTGTGRPASRPLLKRPLFWVLAALGVVTLLTAQAVLWEPAPIDERAGPGSSARTPGPGGPTTSVDVGDGPVAIAVDVITGTVYVANAGGAGNYTVSVIDVQHRPQPSIDLGSTRPAGIAFDHRSALLYVSSPHGGGCRLSVIDTVKANSVTRTQLPINCGSLAIAPSGGPYLYVADPASAAIALVDLRTRSLVRTVETLSGGAIAADDGRELVYLGYIEPVTGLYRMDRYDTTTWELTTALLVHNQVSAHTVDTMGMVWVSKSDTGRLVAIDPGSRSDVASIQAPGRITALAVDTGRRILYAAAADASRLYVIPIR